MMQLDNFSFKIHDKILFKEVDIEFEANKIHIIYGDNGIGKTTFFNILTGQIRNYIGKIILNQNEISQYNALELSEIISICFASQPKSDLWVHEVFSFSNIETSQIQDCIKSFEIAQFMNRNIQELSEGERQWIFIARAMARNTPFILLDEPTAFLDLSKRKKLKEIIFQYSQSHTILINTHDEDLSRIENSTTFFIENQNFIKKIN